MAEKYGSKENYEAKRKEWSRKGGLKAPGLGALPEERRKEISKMGRDTSKRNLLAKYGIYVKDLD